MRTPVEQEHRSSRRRRRRIRVGVFILAVALTALAVFHRPLFLGNFGVVDPGRVYRSAQPRSELPRTIHSHGLASVLNLRGGFWTDAWYADEVRYAQAEGVEFYDLSLEADRRPTRRELLTLLDVLDRCPYPLLIHCKAGADRTGLASALYLMSQRGVPPRRALESFSIWYGHLPLFGPEHLHEPLYEYAAWLDARELSHTPDRLRSWVRDEYRANDPHTDPVPLRPGPRVPLEAFQQARPIK